MVVTASPTRALASAFDVKSGSSDVAKLIMRSNTRLTKFTQAPRHGVRERVGRERVAAELRCSNDNTPLSLAILWSRDSIVSYLRSVGAQP